MFMDINSIDLFDQNVGICACEINVDQNVGTQTHMFMHITCIDLFYHNVGMACAKVRFRCPCTSLVLIYLITMWVWCVPKLDLDVHSYHWY